MSLTTNRRRGGARPDNGRRHRVGRVSARGTVRRYRPARTTSRASATCRPGPATSTRIQYGKLTHINYAFVLPNANGTLQAVENPSKLSSLVSLGHGNNVKVSIAIGGWNDGNDSAFESLAAQRRRPAPTFVNNVVNFVNQYGLDGVDIDWEYPDPGTSGNNYTALMQQLSTRHAQRAASCSPPRWSPRAAPRTACSRRCSATSTGSTSWPTTAAAPTPTTTGPINSVNFWKSRGLPASKTVMGVPFYSRPGYLHVLAARRDGSGQRQPGLHQRVGGGQQCYNGLPTIRRKTQYMLANGGGMMNWELSQDTNNATSLVSAIYETVMGGPNPTASPTGNPGGRVGAITGIAGKCVDVAGASTANGAAVQLYACNGTNAQRWTVATDGTLRALGKCADVTGASTANGTKVQLWDCNGTGAQAWQAQTGGTLRNPASGRCLDATGNSSADGTRLQIWDCAGGPNQQWRLP